MMHLLMLQKQTQQARSEDFEVVFKEIEQYFSIKNELPSITV